MMNEDLQIEQLKQGGNKHQQKLKIFKKNIEKYIGRDNSKQYANLQQQNRVKPVANLIKTTVNKIDEQNQNARNLNTQKDFYKNLNISDESFNNKISDSVSPKNIGNDFSYFNSTLFKNESLFNQNKSNFNIPNAVNNQLVHRHTSSNNWMEDASSYTQNSGGQDSKYRNVPHNSKEKQLLSDIDKLLNSIETKKYGNNNVKNSEVVAQISQVSSGSSTFRKLDDKYNLSDLNFDGSRLSGVSMISDNEKQGSIFGYSKTDFINQKSQRISELPPKASIFDRSVANTPFSMSNKLKTIQEQQGQNTLTIEPALNTIEHDRIHRKRLESTQNMSSIQKQKAKIRQAMSGKKKTSQEISLSGAKFRDQESRLSRENYIIDAQQNDGVKSNIEVRDKSFNISVDFQLSDEQEQYKNSQLISKQVNQQRQNGFAKDKQPSQQEIRQLKQQKQDLLKQLLILQQELQQLEA